MKKPDYLTKLALIATFTISISACTTSSVFTSLGSNIAAPNGISIDSTNNRLYLINSNSTVLYEHTEGSIQIFDITSPLSPVLLQTTGTPSFSGEALQDPYGRNLLYVSNRYSDSTTDTTDQLLVMNIDEASDDFLTVASYSTNEDPYGLYCCYPDNRLWISTEADLLEYKDLGGDLAGGGTISLVQSLSDGNSLTDVETSYITIINNQGFLPRLRGGLLVVNLDEAGDSTKNPVDYLIDDIDSPRGITTDGALIYLVYEGLEDDDDELKSRLLIMDPSSLTPLTDNDTTQVIDKDDESLSPVKIDVGDNAQNVLLTSNYAFVTSRDDDLVTVINLATQDKNKDVSVGTEPFGMALYSPGGVESYLYVGNVESNNLSIIDLTTPAPELAGTYP